MSATHIAIVWNPAKTSKDDLEAALDAAVGDDEGPRVTWLDTTVEDPGRGQAREALDAGADVVVAAGGDGTVRAVAESLAEADTDAALGIVPMGTGNLLARNLDVPLNNLEGAFAAVLGAESRTIDLAWAAADCGDGEQRVAFTVMAGVGVDAHMITETDEDLKDKIGWLAYVESLGRAVSASDVIAMGLTVDDGDAESHDAHTLIVGNCGILTGGITLLPDALPDDGELDMLVLSADGVTGWLDTLRSMVWDNGLKRLVGASDRAESSESVDHRRVTSVVLNLEQPRMLELDGDEVGKTARIEFTVQPGALKVLAPRVS